MYISTGTDHLWLLLLSEMNKGMMLSFCMLLTGSLKLCYRELTVRRQGRSRGTSYETTTLMQMRNNGGLDYAGSEWQKVVRYVHILDIFQRQSP